MGQKTLWGRQEASKIQTLTNLSRNRHDVHVQFHVIADKIHVHYVAVALQGGGGEGVCVLSSSHVPARGVCVGGGGGGVSVWVNR